MASERIQVEEDKRHLVYLVPTFDTAAPRTIRAKQLAVRLSMHYRVSVVCFEAGLDNVTVDHQKDYDVIRVPYSAVSRHITLRRYSDVSYKKLLVLLRPLSFLIRRFFMFPDAWMAERKAMLRALEGLDSPIDIIVASMMPFSTGAVASDYKQSLSINQKLHIVADIGDPLANNAVSKPGRQKSRLIEFEQKTVQMCDHIVVTNEQTKEHYIDNFGIERRAISCVPQGADIVSLPAPIFKESAAAISIVYAGLFIRRLRDPLVLFDVLRDFQSDVLLRVYGDIDEEFKIGNGHIEFNQSIAHELVFEQYRAADCVLYFDNKEGIQTSGKIFELLGLRMPIVFVYDSENSSVKEMCSHYGHIIFCKNNASSIVTVLSTIDQRVENANHWLKVNESEYNTQAFSWDERARQFNDVLKKLT